MIVSHLVWEVLLVDGRACPVACAGDPFALPAQGERNKSSCRELFTFIATGYWLKNKARNKQAYARNEWKGLRRTRSRSNRMHLLVLNQV